MNRKRETGLVYLVSLQKEGCPTGEVLGLFTQEAEAQAFLRETAETEGLPVENYTLTKWEVR